LKYIKYEIKLKYSYAKSKRDDLIFIKIASKTGMGNALYLYIMGDDDFSLFH